MMLEISQRTSNLTICHLLITITSLFATSLSFANCSQHLAFCLNKTCPWHAVVSLGGGVAISSNIGKSHTFPIVNPMTDEFYIYTANRPTQTAGAFDSFIGAEWTFHPNWALQMGLGYNQAWNFRAKGSLLQGADIQSADQYSYNYNILTHQLLAEGKLLYQFKERYHPYILLGLGVAFNEASDYGTNVPPFLTFTRQYQNNIQTSFAYNVGIGIDVDILEHLRLGMGYRFANFGQVKLDKAMIDTTKVGGTLSQTHLYASEILAQFTIVV